MTEEVAHQKRLRAGRARDDVCSHLLSQPQTVQAYNLDTR